MYTININIFFYISQTKNNSENEKLPDNGANSHGQVVVKNIVVKQSEGRITIVLYTAAHHTTCQQGTSLMTTTHLYIQAPMRHLVMMLNVNKEALK